MLAYCLIDQAKRISIWQQIRPRATGGKQIVFFLPMLCYGLYRSRPWNSKATQRSLPPLLIWRTIISIRYLWKMTENNILYSFIKSCPVITWEITLSMPWNFPKEDLLFCLI